MLWYQSVMQTKELINPGHDLSNPDLNLADFSDKDLYHLCQRYGNGIKILRRVFAVLLVEVNRRKLHRKYGFEGIYEFAAKVGGMNYQVTRRILWLAEALRDKPCLWRVFKTEGWSKVRVVASVATKETDKIWAEKVSVSSKPALEVLVKDWRKKNAARNQQKRLCEENHHENLFDFAGDTYVGTEENRNRDLIFGDVNDLESVPGNSIDNQDMALDKPETVMGPKFGDTTANDEKKFIKMKFKVSQETEFKFLLFKQQLCKKKKVALTSGEVLAVLLESVEENKILVIKKYT